MKIFILLKIFNLRSHQSFISVISLCQQYHPSVKYFPAQVIEAFPKHLPIMKIYYSSKVVFFILKVIY